MTCFSIFVHLICEEKHRFLFLPVIFRILISKTVMRVCIRCYVIFMPSSLYIDMFTAFPHD